VSQNMVAGFVDHRIRLNHREELFSSVLCYHGRRV
jgi:hypothetical protein